MLAVIILVFREFLEAFLIAGVFLGVSGKLNLRKEFEIFLALGVGIFFSILLAALVFFFGDTTRSIITAESAELVEGYLMVFAGLFIAYVVFELHRFMKKANMDALSKVKNALGERVFDIAFFFSIVFLILREGLEIALFTASVSLFSSFAENLAGLFVGFLLAAIVGLVAYFSYTALPIRRVFTATEYTIIALGAIFTSNGLLKILEIQFMLDASSISVPFLSAELSALLPLFIGLYVAIVYVSFLRKKPFFKREVQ